MVFHVTLLTVFIVVDLYLGLNCLSLEVVEVVELLLLVDRVSS